MDFVKPLVAEYDDDDLPCLISRQAERYVEISRRHDHQDIFLQSKGNGREERSEVGDIIVASAEQQKPGHGHAISPALIINTTTVPCELMRPPIQNTAVLKA